MQTLVELFTGSAFQRQVRYYAIYLVKHMQTSSAYPYDAEDLAQEINLAIWTRLKEYRPHRAAPRTFLNMLVKRHGPALLCRHLQRLMAWQNMEGLQLWDNRQARHFDMPILLGTVLANLDQPSRGTFILLLEKGLNEILQETDLSRGQLDHQRKKLVDTKTMRELYRKLRFRE